MKTIAIYIDMRGSKKLNLLEKKEKYKKLYDEFRKYNNDFGTIGFHINIEVGDGIILIYKCNKLDDKESLYKLLNELDQKVENLEKKVKQKFGFGISYSESFDYGNDNEIISPSIDGAAVGTNLSNKFKVKNKIWKWVLPLKVANDGSGSIEKLQKIIKNDSRYKFHQSNSNKNLWFNILNQNNE